MHTHQLQAQILACKDTYDVLEALGQASLDVRSLTASEEVLLFELIAEGMRVLGGSETSLSDRQLQQLATLIAARCQPHQAVVAAEALLTAFDNAFQAKLCEVFQGRGGRQTLKPGSPFPIAAHDLKPFFGAGSFTPHPSAFGLPGRQRAYLGIFSKLNRMEVVFDFSNVGLLQSLLRKKTIALAFPNCKASEVDLTPNPPHFFDVRPVNATKQEAFLVRAINRAEKLGAAALLLPELCVTQALAATAGAHACGKRVLTLFAAGSYHATHSGRNVNRLELYSPFLSLPVTHDKVTPFELKAWDNQSYTPALIEGISPTSTITVNWSSGWSLVTLICKDFLDRDVRDTIERLRPNFIFIVAFSSNTASFNANAQAMANNAQATVVICNFVPSSPNDASATVVLPLRARGGGLVQVRRSAKAVLGKMAIIWLAGGANPRQFQIVSV